jgi:metallo-beta-lactamase family protein
MKISFHGADRGITGSCHLIECAGSRLLIDCGLYQGGHEIEEENEEPFGFEPESIGHLLLTHGHLDHCGRIPLLVKQGFRGEIVATAATRELSRLVMLDSAHIQEEEAARRDRHAECKHESRKKHKEEPEGTLYTTLDVLDSCDLFGRPAAYDTAIDLAPGVRATFLDAGHILGSASVLLELEEDGNRRRVIFSGDLGGPGRPILRDPTPPPAVDDVVIETTYGDRMHKPLAPSVDELYESISETFRRGGNVIIPTFALERAQELLYYLREGVESGRLESSMAVFLDSPMAISATEIFGRHPECYDEEMREMFRDGRDPFRVPGLRFTRQATESIAINKISSGAVIMAGSGMCTGGRVRHHLRHHIGREESSVIFVGFAAHGTLARHIIDGASTISIYGEKLPVRARIHTINGFSAHADQAELLAWHAKTSATRTFLVHGDPEVKPKFGDRLKGTRVEIPDFQQEFEL